MTGCHEMKLDEVYVCKACGLELKVVKECQDVGKPADDCGCEEHCGFSCCGEEMKLKSA